VTLPVIWIPDANEDLREARAWYDNIRPALGERFALAVETTVEAIAEYPLLYKPQAVVEALPVLLIAFLLELCAIATIVNPTSKWAFNLSHEKRGAG
jgi:plasmid stabilization system protein ParE